MIRDSSPVREKRRPKAVCKPVEIYQRTIRIGSCFKGGYQIREYFYQPFWITCFQVPENFLGCPPLSKTELLQQGLHSGAIFYNRQYCRRFAIVVHK